MKSSVSDLIDLQIKTQGVACVRVDDGQVFGFPVEYIEKMLAKARAAPSGRVVVFVQRGPEA